MNRQELVNDPELAQRVALDGWQSRMWTASPGIVQSVNLAANTCEVQIAIQGVLLDENGGESFVNMPVLLDVPIVFPSAGGFVITFPIAAGDEVLVVFASRCIDAWWQSGGVQQPMESRMHDLSDGFAIPGPRSSPNVVGSISTTGCQIRNNAGDTYVEVSNNGKIKLVAPSDVEVTGNLKVSGDVTAGTVSLKNHVHSGVTTGGGNSGPPL